jgi:methyl-accepting chemotaxis protein
VVIADEIQRLAENSREATSKISTLVNNIQAETADTVTTMNEAISQVVRGTQLAEQAGTAMRETHANTSDLVDKVQQIAEKSNNQARVTHELRDRSEHIKASTEKTNAELRDQSEQTDLLVQYSDDLLQAVGVFTLPEAESLQQGKK